MNILNLSHPLTTMQTETLAQLAGESIQSVIQLSTNFDSQLSFESQVITLLEQAHMSLLDWESGRWLVVLPSLNYITAVLLAELHGRTGHFPAIVRLRPTANTLIPEFEVAEIINLDQVRQAARARR